MDPSFPLDDLSNLPFHSNRTRKHIIKKNLELGFKCLNKMWETEWTKWIFSLLRLGNEKCGSAKWLMYSIFSSLLQEQKKKKEGEEFKSRLRYYPKAFLQNKTSLT